MLLKDMFDELEKLGGFNLDINKLNDEQIDFLEQNDDFEIGISDLLDIIDTYKNSDYAEICGVYKDETDLAMETVDMYGNILEFLQDYIDYEGLGNALLEDEIYYMLFDGRIAYIGL